MKEHELFRRLCRFSRYSVLRKTYQLFSAVFPGRNSFCSVPWEKAGVKADGRVVCSTAHRSREELCFGNVNDSSFKDIWYGIKYQRLRAELCERSEPFPYLCYTCPYREPLAAHREDPSLLPELPGTLWVEATDDCNLNCPICVRRDERKGAYLSMEAFTSLMDEVGPGLRNLLFYIDGENYMHPRATDMTRYAKKVNPGINIITSTNGLLFSTPEKREDFVRSGVDHAVFSVDGATQESYERYRRGGSLQTVLGNMRGIVEVRRKLEIALHVEWRYILFQWNDSQEEMDLARKLAFEIGVDSLVWLLTTTVGASRRYLSRDMDSFETRLPFERFEPTEIALKERILHQKFV